ncbi:hypothetical protein BST81_05505 [Leptolyngbya sp. 'hensonii']|uniref:DUF3086 domain-containing protein n=1 Tax=Leptolyngbya sp. 'hensonii' TaxID=1922337 RepID=UPI0009500F1A|nr:DUF3086 domain-containing protein [Leptolyngbya sp. 'hensonii']OLP19223.1 hypothetical protein BST81_05505 [Leptolyngbya sp. 'hensonii']
MDSSQSPSETAPSEEITLERRVADLRREEQALRQDLETLRSTYHQLQKQVAEIELNLGRMFQQSLGELEQRKQTLQIAVEQLERRQERIRTEMRTTFAGASQDLAIRVQGFKDYLVGSLQDLVTAAEQLQLLPQAAEPASSTTPAESSEKVDPKPKFAERSFEEEAKEIRALLDRYRSEPDYYGAPWSLRRTFEPVHADRVSNWFFKQGGRGAIRTVGSRLQNILVASAVISVLREFYDDDLRTLILANSPERLGEWRRGLQDCLGISRADFGPEQGVSLFETAEAVTQKADRLLKQGELPLIVIDESEVQVNLSLLQYPLWLGYAADPQAPNSSMRYS